MEYKYNPEACRTVNSCDLCQVRGPVSLIVVMTKRPAFILISLHFMRWRANEIKIKIFMAKTLLAVQVANYNAEVV